LRIDAAGRLPVDGTGFSSSISAQTWCAGHLRADEPPYSAPARNSKTANSSNDTTNQEVTLTPRDRPIHRSPSLPVLLDTE
jgi:hypothetical protein